MKLGTFEIGARSEAIAFDGTNVWLTSTDGVDVVTELRARDGIKVGTYRIGYYAPYLVVDGKTSGWRTPRA